MKKFLNVYLHFISKVIKTEVSIVQVFGSGVTFASNETT